MQLIWPNFIDGEDMVVCAAIHIFYAVTCFDKRVFKEKNEYPGILVGSKMRMLSFPPDSIRTAKKDFDVWVYIRRC